MGCNAVWGVSGAFFKRGCLGKRRKRLPVLNFREIGKNLMQILLNPMKHQEYVLGAAFGQRTRGLPTRQVFLEMREVKGKGCLFLFLGPPS